MAGEVADGLEGWAMRLKLLLWRERAEVKAGLRLGCYSLDRRSTGVREVNALYRCNGWGSLSVSSLESRVSTYCGLRCAMYDMSISVRMT